MTDAAGPSRPRRRPLPLTVRVEVLTEAGYRCAVPTCRQILAIDIHHLVEVAEGGGNKPDNLIALCPTCHALFHRGIIHRESLNVWKTALRSLTEAFGGASVDDLLFISLLRPRQLGISGDGVLRYSRLIAGGLVSFGLLVQNGPILLYEVKLTERGQRLVDAWKEGGYQGLAEALGQSST